MNWSSFRTMDPDEASSPATIRLGTFDLAEVGAVEREPGTDKPSWCVVRLRWGRSYQIIGEDVAKFLAAFDAYSAGRGGLGTDPARE